MGEREFQQNVLAKAVEGAISEQVREASELRVATPGGQGNRTRKRRKP